MRKLTDHKLTEVNNRLSVTVCDNVGHGNAHYHYIIHTGDDPNIGDKLVYAEIKFQCGPIKECGINGLTHEALLAILIDRLRSFQEGEYSCKENAVALTHIETALLWLKSRTLARMARGVEGTHQK